MNQIDNFSVLGLSDEMLDAVKSKGFESPTSIQRLTIPKLLTQDNDIIAQSQTGTGKTAAYGLPIMQLLEPRKSVVQAIVLVPTRELALQASEELISYNRQKKLSITAIYGGASISEQLRRLTKGVDIVVGTPGRVLDLMRRGALKLEDVRFLVLDEADEMLNMGFVDDVEEIMSHTNGDRRVLLFSATMPGRIVKLSERYMRNTEILKVEAQQLTTDLTDQIYFEVRESDKFDALTRIIDIHPEFYGIVFSRTKVGADELVTRLLERGYAAECLHGDVSQAQREKILKKFKDQAVNILVATDVAARGIDVSNLSHVINYSLPQDSESYVHRIGRTGRAGNQGTAITFISNSEFRRFNYLKKDINADIKRETLPSAQDIVVMKKQKIKDDLQEIVSSETLVDYSDIVSDILAQYEPQEAVAALLRLAFKGELDEGNYPEIRSFSVDRKGTTRLFLAVGKRDGFTARKVVDMLKRRAGLRDKHIDDIKISENFSFVSVPFSEAEDVVMKLNESSRGRAMAEIAKDENSGGGGSAPRGERRARPSSSEGRGGYERRESRGSSRSDEGRAERGAGRGRQWSDDAEPSRREPTRVLRKSELRGDESRPARRAERPAPAQVEPRTEGRVAQGSESGGFDWSFFEGTKWENEVVSSSFAAKKRVKKEKSALTATKRAPSKSHSAKRK